MTRIWVITAMLALSPAVALASDDKAASKARYADLWQRCVDVVIGGAALNMEGLETLDAERSAKAASDGARVYRVPVERGMFKLDLFPDKGYYLHKIGRNGCRIFAQPVSVGDAQVLIWKDLIDERDFVYHGVEELERPTVVIHRYSKRLDDGRRVAVTSRTPGVFSKQAEAVIEEVIQ